MVCYQGLLPSLQDLCVCDLGSHGHTSPSYSFMQPINVCSQLKKIGVGAIDVKPDCGGADQGPGNGF